ncbi:ABC-F family ATP-binding cassette domain-containing protein [Sandaracinobacteroides saxicola]|uniref:ABC-F family ATP-binding cassette domain-containing protein n=1 Tax=Sandaracinobacteroides saxicola TaxID=2759707 RepID=A0A7G5IEJ2_9SPHN|nr:ABC-F family ATP-binding cassette domain-containing protein [Sandaracinobacteroides saxicola]QMW21784.1 ABC-F family ATP-binding cassette domain-containing protein [Sandaracinobacteroides saxicola]
MPAPILAVENLALQQGDGWLFTDLSLFVGENDRLALIGRNGAGKTTLFRLLAGQVEADRGRRTVQPGRRIVTLLQDPSVEGFATLADFALAGADAPPAHAVQAIADQLGIDLGRDAATASGGERRRAAIARALASEPDLLLLDEPTNHLDLDAIQWLEDWLTRFRGAFIVISHDRAFLTRLTRACLWLDRGTLRRQEVGFGGFEAWAESIAEEDARAAQKLDSKLRLELHWLQRGVTARRRRNQGRLAKLHEMRAARRAMLGAPGVAKLALASDDVKTRMVIEADAITKSYGGRIILKPFSIRIQRGDRIGIVGGNGTGKTTLLRLLTGELEPDSGTVTRAKTLAGVLIDQQRRLMDPAKRVRDILANGGDWVTVRGEKKHIQGYLKDFLFEPGLADARIGTFSGGERSRLLLAREFARESNLLVLDEPTNDLDLETLDLLQDVIADYDGTVLIVSHDRDFLDRTVTMTIGLDGSGQALLVAGGYQEVAAAWAAQKQPRKTSSASPPARGSDPSLSSGTGERLAERERRGPASGGGQPSPGKKLSFRDQHDLDRLPAEIARLDAEIAAAETALADPDLYTRNPARFTALSKAADELRARKDAAETRWLTVAELAEALG